MRRRLVIVAALALVAAGCGEDAAQHAARVAVQERAGGARTHCTPSARLYLEPIATKIFLCNVSRRDGLCDSWIATRRGQRFDVRLRHREVDCILPVG
jgi:hypothetical protein